MFSSVDKPVGPSSLSLPVASFFPCELDPFTAVMTPAALGSRRRMLWELVNAHVFSRGCPSQGRHDGGHWMWCLGSIM